MTLWCANRQVYMCATKLNVLYDRVHVFWQAFFAVYNAPFLGEFAKLRKAAISFVMSLSVCLSVRPSVSPSVCLSVRMEQLGSQWTDVHEIRCLSFSKICRENSRIPFNLRP
jgi:hypothetical protein